MKTLRGKISILYLSLVAMIALVGTFAVICLYQLTGAIDGLMIDNFKSIKAVAQMLDAVEQQESAVLTYISIDREEGVNRFIQSGSNFADAYNIAMNNVTELGENEHIGKVQSYYIAYGELFSKLQEVYRTKGEEEAGAFYKAEMLPALQKLKNELQQLSDVNERIMLAGRENTTRNARTFLYFLLTISFITVTAGFFASRFLANKFLRPIESLTGTIKLIKAGNLDCEAQVLSEDETGELAAEINRMTQRLREYDQGTLGRLVQEKNKSIAIVKSISDPLIVLDTNFHTILANKAFEDFFHIRESFVLRKHFVEAVSNGELFDFIKNSALGKNDGPVEKIISLRNGEVEHYFKVVITRVDDGKKNLAGLVILFQNVTQLKLLEKIRTDFLSTISHELKTPLTSIMMGLSLLKNSEIGSLNQKQEALLATAEEECERLSVLVHDLLELSRIESGRSVFQIHPCSIAAIVENSVKHLYGAAERKDIKLYYEAEEDLPYIMADPEKITWVVNNLLTNALKYTNAGDEIGVKAFVHQDLMYVQVKDTGMGIPEEFQKKIFDKFVQVKSYDLEVRGTGLGLAIVKDIVQTHHGDIWCDSRLDAGSTFTFTLPLAKEERS